MRSKISKSIFCLLILMNYSTLAFACALGDNINYTIVNDTTNQTIPVSYFFGYGLDNGSQSLGSVTALSPGGETYSFQVCASGSAGIGGNTKARLAISAGPYVFVLSHDVDQTQSSEPNLMPGFASNAMGKYLINSSSQNVDGKEHAYNGVINWVVYGTSGGQNQPVITYGSGENCGSDICGSGTAGSVSGSDCPVRDLGCHIDTTYYIYSVPTTFQTPLGPGQ